MPTQESMKRQIARTEDLGSVVGTMKAMAAVSIRQYEQAVESLDEFNRTIELGLRALIRTSPTPPQPLAAREKQRRVAVVLGSDQGMCGRFNEDIVNFAATTLQGQEQGNSWELVVMGQRALGPLEGRGWPVIATLRTPSSTKGMASAVQDLVFTLGGAEDLGEVLVFVNRQVSGSSYEPQVVRLLPVDRPWYDELGEAGWPTNQLPAHGLAAERLFAFLVRQYLFVALFRAVAHSLAGENASRLASMQAAEKNIEEKIVELTGRYHQARQSAITEELLDIVSGFQTLNA